VGFGGSTDRLIAAGVGVTIFSVATFFLLLIAAWRGEVSVRTILALVVGYHVVVLMLPLLFSHDVYSYAFYGRIAGVYHANPYLRTPINYPSDPLFGLAGPKWIDTPAVYGPLFSTIGGAIARIFKSAMAQVGAYRGIAVTASLATAVVTARSARALRPARAAFAVAAFGANPVVLFQSVASGHNDLLVALSIAVGLLFLSRGRELAAVASLTLGALVKVSGVLPLLLLIVWCVSRRPSGQRLRALITRGGTACAITLAFALPYMQWKDPTLGMRELAGHRSWLAPSSLLQKRVADLFTNGIREPAIGFVFWAVLLAAVIALLIVVARRAPVLSVAANGAAWGWGLILLMLLGPVLLPWYLIWAMPLVWLVPKVPRTTLLAAGALVMLAFRSAEVVGLDTPVQGSWVGHWFLPLGLAALIAWTLFDFGRRILRNLPLEDEEDVTASSRDG
jgi:alpha-1,6-mannosyltransferase